MDKLDLILEKLEAQQEEIAAVNITLENRVFPALEALAEGQKTILETLTPKSRVEAIADEVDFLKTVIRAMNKDIAELKKAQ